MTDIEPTEQQNQDQQQHTGTGVHSSWDGVLEMFPEGAQREALLAQIKESERNSSTAIQKARESATPEEWQGIIEAARESGVTPDEIGASYNQMLEMQEQIQADPDGWLNTMKAEIDQAVERGDITRKEGAQLKRDATTQANDAGVDLEDPQIAEMRKELEEQKRWREQQSQQQQEFERQQQEEQANAEVQRQTQEFIETFENAFNTDPALKDVEAENRYVVANHAVNLMQSNDSMTPAQATAAAIDQFRKMGALPSAASTQAPPIGGGTNGHLPGVQAPGRGDARGIDKDRAKAMEEELARLAASGIV